MRGLGVVGREGGSSSSSNLVFYAQPTIAVISRRRGGGGGGGGGGLNRTGPISRTQPIAYNLLFTPSVKSPLTCLIYTLSAPE